MKVTIYVEGGGDQDRTLTECRKAFHSLLDHIRAEGQKPKIVACGGRGEAFANFCRAVNHNEGDFPMLLIDAEDPVMQPDPWAHLSATVQWQKPRNATAEQAHLMVQCMESWFLADVGCLEDYFGRGFSKNALPANPNIEAIPKRDILNGIESAARRTSKQRYRKMRDGFSILARLDFDKVCARSPHAGAFRETIQRLVEI